METEKNKQKETYSYRGWLNSDSFLKRAFAVYGYAFVAGLIIIVPLYVLMLIFGILFYLLLR